MSRLTLPRAAVLATLALLLPMAAASSAAADGFAGQGTTDGRPTAAAAVGPAPSRTLHLVDDPSSPEGWRFDPTAGADDTSGDGTGRIIGGTATTPAAFPWSVFLYSDNPATNYETTCGGAILNANTIVTAAHCLTGVTINASPTKLGLGVIAGLQNYNTRATGQSRTVVSARVHPQWQGDINASSGGDIAVLTLDSNLDLSGPNAKPIALPPVIPSVNGDPIVPPTTNVLEAGYGDQDQASHADGSIHQLAAAIVDPSICQTFAVSAPTLCAQSPTGTPCHGDSGSALVAPGPTPMILGVVSGGPVGTCQPGNGVAYTSLITPENRVFLDGGTPVIAPRQTDYTRWKTSGPFQTGQTLTCFGDAWSNGATVKWVVSNETGAVVASGFGATFNYAFAASDVGHTLACRSYGSNAGGVGVGDRVPLTQPIAQGPVVAPKPNVSTGNGMTATGPKAVGRGHTGTFKVNFATVPAGSTRIKVKISVNGKHGTSITKTYRIPTGSTAGSVTMKLKLSKKLSTGTKTVTIAATTYTGTKKNGDTRKLTVKVKVKKS
ncbi:MAG: serine protease [Solirubrobacteraceae bacterium]|nr:serine protease [Patulibacter sp.]